MHKYFTACLLISLSLNLSAQYEDWDNHLLINDIFGGTETSTDIWCIAQSSLLKINKKSKELSIYQNAETGFGAWGITDIWADTNDRMYYISDHIGYYENSQWYKQETPQLPQNQSIKKLLGKNDTGAFYFLTYNGVLISWKIGQPAEQIPITQGYISEGLMEDNGTIWLMGSDWIGSWKNGVFELSLSEELPQSYLNQIQLGHTASELWVKDLYNMYYKKNNIWHIVNFQETFDLANVSSIKPIAPQKALVIAAEQVFIVSLVNDEWEIENISASFPEDHLPLSYYAFADDSGTIWHINKTNKNLSCWQLDKGFSKITNTTWPTVSETNTLALDPAGRIWLGGGNGLNYLQGGKWHQWEPITHDQFDFGLNELIFTDQSKPLVATGSFLFFGIPTGGIMQWDEETNLWEDIDLTDSGLQGQVITALAQDQHNNIWTIGGFQNNFGVLSNGQWFQYTPRDVPLDSIARFTTFAEDPDGSMWIGTDRGILNYNGFQFKNFDFRELQLSTVEATALLVDSKGHLWVALRNAGVLKWDREIWQHFSEESIGIEGGISVIKEGNHNEMWFALNRGGVVRFDGEEWTYFNPQNSGLHSLYIGDIQKDKRGRIWFAGGNGVSVYHENKAQIPIFELAEEQNIAIFPNPGCCVFQVNWQQNEAGKTTIELYNMQGQKLRILFDNEIEAGEQELLFNRDDLPSGVYTIVVRQSNKIFSEMLIIN